MDFKCLFKYSIEQIILKFPASFYSSNKNALLNSVDREVLVSVATQIMGQEPIEETKKN